MWSDQFLPRKRRNSNNLTSPPGKAKHVSQRRKYSYISKASTVFWDNLSKVDLTKRAFRELQRRQKPVTRISCTLDQQLCGRHTRHIDHLATQILGRYEKKALKDVKQFARYGSPDLFTLRSVRWSYNAVTNTNHSIHQFPNPVPKSC